MKIGIISATKDLPWAAPDEVWSRFAELALNQGHHVCVSVHHALSMDKMSALVSKGLKVSARHPFRPTKLHLLKERSFSSLRPLERFNPDVVLFNGGSIQDAFYQPDLQAFCERSLRPLVYFCHGHSDEYKILEREHLAAFLGGLAGLVFVSEENRKILETQLVTKFSKSCVIRNSPSISPEAPLPATGNHEVCFACVARVDAYWKGHDVLLRVLGEPQWRNRSWRLGIFGKGADEEHIKKLASHLGLADRVAMHGQVEDLLKVWQESDVMLLPSRAESLSLAMLEAMSCGRVVVTTDVGDHRYVIEDGKTGFIAEVATVDSFGRALERAWIARDQWPEIGRSAHLVTKQLIGASPSQLLLDYLLSVSIAVDPKILTP